MLSKDDEKTIREYADKWYRQSMRNKTLRAIVVCALSILCGFGVGVFGPIGIRALMSL